MFMGFRGFKSWITSLVSSQGPDHHAGLLYEAIREENLPEVIEQVQHVSSINYQYKGWTFLMVCARNNTSRDIADVLIRQGADCSLSNSHGYTAFMCACLDRDRHAPVMQALLELYSRTSSFYFLKSRTDLNVKNSYGNTALMEAVDEDSPRCADMLLRAGADWKLKDDDGWTICMLSCVKRDARVACLRALMRNLPRSERRDMVEMKNPAGHSSLMIAVLEESPDCADWLLRAGADWSLTYSDGWTMFMKACIDKDSRVDLLRTLLRHIPPAQRRDLVLDVKNPAGNTALMIAVLEGSPVCVRLLLAAGAVREGTYTEPPYRDMTVMEVARSIGNTEVRAEFLNQGNSSPFPSLRKSRS